MATDVKQAVIMVGGKGTRLKPLTDTRPKPLLPVLSRPCLKYLIESFVRAGITEVILACGYRSKQLVEAIGDGSDMGVDITYAYEDAPLGTAGAMKNIEGCLDDVFVAANGDIFADISLGEEIGIHLATGAAVTLALTTVENPCEVGIVRLDSTGRIVEFKEKPKPEEVFSNLINAGIYVVNKQVLDLVPKDTFFDFSKDLFQLLLDRGDRIQGFDLKGIWRDVGRPSDLLGVNIIMASKSCDSATRAGKRLDGTTVNEPFYLGERSTLTDSMASEAVILDRCVISGTRIVKSLIMSGCDITSATIEGSILGEGCVIGSGARIMNSVLGDGMVIRDNAHVIDTRVGK